VVDIIVQEGKSTRDEAARKSRHPQVVGGESSDRSSFEINNLDHPTDHSSVEKTDGELPTRRLDPACHQSGIRRVNSQFSDNVTVGRDYIDQR
jgi:hypothetical protein